MIFPRILYYFGCLSPLFEFGHYCINEGNMVLVGALCPGFCLNIFYRLVLPTSKKALRPGPVYRRWVGLNKVLPRISMAGPYDKIAKSSL